MNIPKAGNIDAKIAIDNYQTERNLTSPDFSFERACNGVEVTDDSKEGVYQILCPGPASPQVWIKTTLSTSTKWIKACGVKNEDGTAVPANTVNALDFI